MNKSMNALHHERTIFWNHRAGRSLIDHRHVIEAIEQHDTELAEQFARQHNLNLAM